MTGFPYSPHSCSLTGLHEYSQPQSYFSEILEDFFPPTLLAATKYSLPTKNLVDIADLLKNQPNKQTNKNSIGKLSYQNHPIP